MKDLKVDFANVAFTKEQLEEMMSKKINNIEIKKLEDQFAFDVDNEESKQS